MTTTITGSGGVSKVQTGAIEHGDLPTGSVLQVVSASTGTTTTIGTTAWVSATNLLVSITPKFANSKIMVTANVDFDANTANRIQWFSLFRGSTNLGDSGNGFSSNVADSGRMQSTIGMSYLDSPNTTSSTTYQVYSKVNSNYAYINLYGSHSTITVTEIAG